MTEERNSEQEEALARISEAMTRNRLMTRRRIIGRIAISHVAPALEITHLDVLDVVYRASQTDQATIGSVADGMRIDPSRASRIVAELVSQDVLERRVCQNDARRSVLVITAKGSALLAEIHAVKHMLLETITESWTPEELDTFSRLYERFTEGLEHHARDFTARTCSEDEHAAAPSKGT